MDAKQMLSHQTLVLLLLEKSYSIVHSLIMTRNVSLCHSSIYGIHIEFLLDSHNFKFYSITCTLVLQGQFN